MQGVSTTDEREKHSNKKNIELDFLKICTKGGPIKKIQSFLEQGVDVNIRASGRSALPKGTTALMSAVCCGHNEVVELLLAAHADVHIVYEKPRIVDRLHEQGTDAFARKYRYWWHTEKVTVLMQAVKNGHRAITECLLQYGADVNARNDLRISVLMLACGDDEKNNARYTHEFHRDQKADTQNTVNRTALVEYLIEHGANIHGRDRNKRTPIIAASEHMHAGIVTCLIKHGADVNAKNKDGITALMYAAKLNQIPTVIDLLENGADVNAKDNEEVTPLMYAAQSGNLDVCDTLLGYNADKEAWDNKNRTAIDHAPRKLKRELRDRMEQPSSFVLK